MDIPDLARSDSDGLRDRPRIPLWTSDGKVTLDAANKAKFGEVQVEVHAMLGEKYLTVERESWRNNYHHIGTSFQGGIVLENGSIVGWTYKPGGLGYFDFDYDPVVERVAYWTPKLDTTKVREAPRRLYRVRNCTQ